MPFFLSNLATVPNAGARYETQYLITTTSGSRFAIFFAVLKYEKGLMESSTAMLSITFALSRSVTYCVLPGKRSEGYCLLKVKALT